jgi:hypothetical protein
MCLRELRFVRVCPLADVGEGVELAALEELEFHVGDVGQTAAGLNAGGAA